MDTASPNHEVDANLYMTLPEGTDVSAIFPTLNKQSTASIKQTMKIYNEGN
jgi:hypothetical protein